MLQDSIGYLSTVHVPVMDLSTVFEVHNRSVMMVCS